MTSPPAKHFAPSLRAKAKRPSVLFLCTGNSCRSQMAEGWARALHGSKLEVASAGVEAHGLNPRAVQVMAEAGVDISRQASRCLEELAGLEPDLVVTVCDHAAEVCPIFPGSAKRIHRSFRDPAKAKGEEEEVLGVFRAVREEIRDFVRGLPELLDSFVTLERWDREGGGEAAEFGFFRIRSFEARSPRTGERHSFSVIDTSDWVNVIATTASGEVVLVRQYRHGTEEFSLEIPGGVIDEGEDPAAAAVRELREETGFEGESPLHLGTVEPNPAILSNRCHTYLVRNARRTEDPAQDAGEDIEVSLFPLSEIPGAIARGGISHALVVCAFWWYAQRYGGLSLGESGVTGSK